LRIGFNFNYYWFADRQVQLHFLCPAYGGFANLLPPRPEAARFGVKLFLRNQTEEITTAKIGQGMLSSFD
jgi:hypothetical protein